MARIDPPARDALRLGAYQLLHTRVPAHAAVVVHRGPGPPGRAGRAGLRQRGAARGRHRTDLDAWVEKLAPDAETDPVGHLAVAHAIHSGSCGRSRRRSAATSRETERLLIEDNEPRRPCTCAPGPGRVDAVELADEVGGAPGAFSPYAVYLPGGAPGDLAAIRDGRAHVQDEGSQLVAAALADAPLDGAGRGAGSTCAPGPAARPGCSARSPRSAAPR